MRSIELWAKVREVSAHIAAAVAAVAWRQGHAPGRAPGDLLRFVRDQMYDPAYDSYV